MPGGKVVVYTGILPVTQDEASLASCNGARNCPCYCTNMVSERMSQWYVSTIRWGSIKCCYTNKTCFNASFISTILWYWNSQLGMLKFSRNHETEADKMGLIFAAMGGYDPNAAVTFWERMAAASGGGKPMELLSTHPSDATRIADLKAFMPEAIEILYASSSTSRKIIF
jgi:Zn-dependent protease with chaperone function